jgi:hypothetical protein
MGYSSLAKSFMPAHSNNYQKGRSGYKICKFTPHHIAGVLSAQRCGQLFQDPNRQASANYGIGNDGTIICYVDEDNRAYTSSNKANDCQAITVEVSNSSTGGDWPISEAAWNSLVNLAVDVCRRYDFRLVYDGTPEGSLTRHNLFAATACPGPYLQSRFEELAEVVNARLEETKPTPAPEPAPTPVPEVTVEGYLVKVTANVLNIRADAGTEYKITGQITDHGVYTIVAEKDGTGASKWGKLKSGAGWISLDYVERQTSTPAKKEEPAKPQIKKGSKVQLTGKMTYSGIRLADWTYGEIFDVIEISGDRVVIGKGTAVTAAVHINDCRLV